LPVIDLKGIGGGATRQLDLSKAQHGPMSALVIGALVAHNPTLTRLSLYRNRLLDEGGVFLARALETNKTLTLVDLAYNGLGVGSGVAFGDALKKNATLRALDLYHNDLHDDGALALWRSVRVHAAMEEINLQYNGLSMGAKEELRIGATDGDRRVSTHDWHRRELGWRSVVETAEAAAPSVPRFGSIPSGTASRGRPRVRLLFEGGSSTPRLLDNHIDGEILEHQVISLVARARKRQWLKRVGAKGSGEVPGASKVALV
jgi:hypothetical protein